MAVFRTKSTARNSGVEHSCPAIPPPSAREETREKASLSEMLTFSIVKRLWSQ